MSSTGAAVSTAAHARLLLLIIAAALLVPWPERLFGQQQQPQHGRMRFANAQGNSFDQKEFTAAPAEDIDTLQNLLEVSDSYTGGS
jgi:hypothetical protein